MITSKQVKTFFRSYYLEVKSYKDLAAAYSYYIEKHSGPDKEAFLPALRVFSDKIEAINKQIELYSKAAYTLLAFVRDDVTRDIIEALYVKGEKIEDIEAWAFYGKTSIYDKCNKAFKEIEANYNSKLTEAAPSEVVPLVS